MSEAELNIQKTEELVKLFDELTFQNQKKVVVNAAKRAGKIILDQAKQNLDGAVKVKGQRYREIRRGFRIEPLRTNMGAAVGVKHYIAKWLEEGTKERYTRKGIKKAYRGKMVGTKFFENAVNAKKNEAVESFQGLLVDEMEKLVEKYSK